MRALLLLLSVGLFADPSADRSVVRGLVINQQC